MSDKDDIEEFVKIYASDSERISLLGSVLHNNKSRAMWLLMMDNPDREFYLKEMAVIIEKDDNPRLPIYEHHIGVMVKAGIVKINIKMHNKHKTKFYRALPFVMLASSTNCEKVKTSKTLRNAFKQVFKLGAIALVGCVTWVSSNSLSSTNFTRFELNTFIYIPNIIRFDYHPSDLISSLISIIVMGSFGWILYYTSIKKKLKG